MEIDKQFLKLNQTCVSFENAIKKDIQSIINSLTIQFDIYERGTNEFVTTDKLTKEILKMFEFTQQINFCSGVTKMGTRCTKRSIIGSEYCKAHIYKHYMSQQTSIHNANKDGMLYMMTESPDNVKEKIDGVEKTLIDGTFYYTDSSFIYDNDSFDKVGYIEDGKYVLTDDPFVLQ